MKEYIVVSNDDVENIIFSTCYLSKLSEYLGKTENNIKSQISKHNHEKCKRWRGNYKIVAVEAEV